MRKLVTNIKVLFFEFGLYFDFPIILTFLCLNYKYSYALSLLKDRDDLKDLTNTFISTCTTISGFSLAALTIIISIRSNVMSRKDSKPENALEKLFQTKGFFIITRIFKYLILEQTGITIGLFSTWFFYKYNSNVHLTALFISIYVLLVTVIRLFYILFFVLESEKITKKPMPEIPQQKF